MNDPLQLFVQPDLGDAALLIAFEGWNDACEAASGAVHYILGRSDTEEPFATLEPEAFFDFQEHRPEVEIDAGGTRRLTWPDTQFYGVPRPDDDHDLILVVGDEPSFRWKTFSRVVVSVLSDLDVESVVLIGAYIGQASHRQPVPLAGTAVEPNIVSRYQLDASNYEGPTGIVGVLMEACRELGMPALSIWAATPPYLAANANPSTMLALLDKAAEVLGTTIETDGLRRLAAEFVERVDEALEDEDDELVDFIASLERPALTEADLGGLFTEIEDFLRGQG